VRRLGVERTGGTRRPRPLREPPVYEARARLFSSASAEPVAVASFGLLGLTLAVARSGPGSSRGPVLATVELELAHVLAVALEDAHAA